MGLKFPIIITSLIGRSERMRKKTVKRHIDRIVRSEIRKCTCSRKRYNDLIAPLVAGITFKSTILPILTMALKAGVTAGIATGISGGIIMPIINRIKNYGFSLVAGKVQGRFSESIIQKIKNDITTLINIFRTKDPAVAKKLMYGLSKFDSVT
jgi:hypothetical protein